MKDKIVIQNLSQKALFNCNRCGFYCQLNVKLSKEDIEKIKSLCFEEGGFIDMKNNTPFLKKIGNHCIFLKTNLNKKTNCAIYNVRPQICRVFPFQRDPNRIYYKCKQADRNFSKRVMMKVIEFHLGIKNQAKE